MTIKIPLLVPDMPTTAEILPWLKQMDENRWYTNFGPLNQLFSEQLLAHFKPVCPHYITTINNATIGLELSLQALGLPLKSAVLVPAFTFVATATAVVRAGLTPIIADIDPNSWLLTPEIALEAARHYKFAAVMPVSSLGCPQDVLAWDAFTKATGIPVIIDAAGAFGNQKTGTKTTLVFSLHATKALGVGEGGFIISPDHDLIKRIRVLSNFGMGALPEQPRMVQEAGTNGKLSEYHAGVGLAALARWPEREHARLTLFKSYRQALLSELPDIQFQAGCEQFIHTILAVRLPPDLNIAHLCADLAGEGIATIRWYYPPIHQHQAFAHFPHAGALNHINEIAPSILGLPFHLHLSANDINVIVHTLKHAVAVEA